MKNRLYRTLPVSPVARWRSGGQKKPAKSTLQRRDLQVRRTLRVGWRPPFRGKGSALRGHTPRKWKTARLVLAYVPLPLPAHDADACRGAMGIAGGLWRPDQGDALGSFSNRPPAGRTVLRSKSENFK